MMSRRVFQALYNAHNECDTEQKMSKYVAHLYFTIIRFVMQSKYQHTKLAKVHSQWFFRLIPKMLSARIFPTAREKGLRRFTLFRQASKSQVLSSFFTFTFHQLSRHFTKTKDT